MSLKIKLLENSNLSISKQYFGSFFWRSTNGDEKYILRFWQLYVWKSIKILFTKLFHHILLWKLNFWKLLKIHCWLEIALFANFDQMRTTSYLLWIHRGQLHILSLPKHMLPVHQPAKQIVKTNQKKTADKKKKKSNFSCMFLNPNNFFQFEF